MPNKITHNRFCHLLGLNSEKANRINEVIDSPIVFFGKNHRKVMHNDASGVVLALLTNDPETFLIHDSRLQGSPRTLVVGGIADIFR